MLNLSQEDWTCLDRKWRTLYDALARAVSNAGGMTFDRRCTINLDELRDAAVAMREEFERALELVGWPNLPQEELVGRDGVAEFLRLYQACCRLDEAADILREEPIHRDFEFFLSQFAAAGELIAEGAAVCKSRGRDA
jgi:hypothetical protein